MTGGIPEVLAFQIPFSYTFSGLNAASILGIPFIKGSAHFRVDEMNE